MVKLTRYRAQQGLATPGTPDVRVSAYKAQALEAFGSQLTQTASHFGAALQDRQTRRQKFEADAAFNKWKGGVGTAFDDATFNMEPGANGFAGGFMSGTFETSAADFLAQLEKITDDPEILDFYRNAVEMERTRVGSVATEAERKEMVRFQTDHINTLAEEQIGLLVTDPDSYDTVTTGLHGLIDASNLPAIERAELHKQVDVAAAEGLLTAYADDPLKQFELLGGDWDKLSPDAQGKLMTEALGEVPAPLVSALEQLSGARSGFDTTKPQVQERWVSDVPPEQLGMIGGAGQSGSSIIAQGHDTGYGDYSMAFRVVSFDRAAAGGENAIAVGQRNGRTVWAAPGYYRDPKTGDIVTHVSAAQAAQLARDNGGLIMTKAEFAEFQRQATEVQFEYQKGPDGGPATNQPGKGDGKASSDYYLRTAGEAMQTGVWGMKEMVVSGNTVPVAMPVLTGLAEQKGGVAYGIVRVGEYNMNLADAIRIGRKIDPGAPKSMSPEVWAEYMANPVLSQAYAQAFFAEALETNGGDRAAAYVQFFLGDERAAEWNEGGRKAGDLPRDVSRAMGDVARVGPRNILAPRSARWVTDRASLAGVDERVSQAVMEAVNAANAASTDGRYIADIEVWSGADNHSRNHAGHAIDIAFIDNKGNALSWNDPLVQDVTVEAVRRGIRQLGAGPSYMKRYDGNRLPTTGDRIHIGGMTPGYDSEGNVRVWSDSDPEWGNDYTGGVSGDAAWLARLQAAVNDPVPLGAAGAAATPKLPGVKGLIVDGYTAAGIDPAIGLMFGDIESSFDPTLVNPRSGATGLMQIIPKFAVDYGVGGMDLKDPEVSIRGSINGIRASTKFFREKMGRDPTPGELYLMHQQGRSGALSLLSNPNAMAADVVGRDAVTQNGGNPDTMTAQQFADKWIKEGQTRYAKYAGGLGGWAAQAQGRGYTGVGDPRLGALPAKRRAAALEDALTAINGKAPTLTDQRASSKISLDDEIARMEQTGSFSEGFDINAALAPLTVGDQEKYARKAEIAEWTHAVNKAVPTWSEEEMIAQLNAYDKPPAPGEYKSPLQREKEEVVRKAIEAEQAARKADPAEASLNLEDVASAWSDISVALGGIPKGFGIIEALSTPGAIEDLRSNAMAVVRFIDKSVATQVQHFGMNPTNIKHLPVDLLKQIGRDVNTLLTLPNRDGKLKQDDIALFMVAAKAIFGDYADEVILEAIEVMDGTPENIEGSAHQKLYDAVKEDPRYFAGQAEIVRKLKEKASGASDTSDPDNIPVMLSVPDDPIEDTADVPLGTTADGLTPGDIEILRETIVGLLDSGYTADEVRVYLRQTGLDSTIIDQILENKGAK